MSVNVCQLSVCSWGLSWRQYYWISFQFCVSCRGTWSSWQWWIHRLPSQTSSLNRSLAVASLLLVVDRVDLILMQKVTDFLTTTKFHGSKFTPRLVHLETWFWGSEKQKWRKQSWDTSTLVLMEEYGSKPCGVTKWYTCLQAKYCTNMNRLCEVLFLLNV